VASWASERGHHEELGIDDVARAQAIVEVQVALVDDAGAGHAAPAAALVERAGAPAERALVVEAAAEEAVAVEGARVRLDPLGLPQHVVGSRRELVDLRVADEPALEIDADVEAVRDEVTDTEADEQVILVERVPPPDGAGHAPLALGEHAGV